MSQLPLTLPFWRNFLFPRRQSADATPALPAGEAVLSAGAMVVFDPKPSLRILVVEGTFWITQTGEDQDFVVNQGEFFVPASHGKIVGQAMTDVRARICYTDAGRAKVCSTQPDGR